MKYPTYPNLKPSGVPELGDVPEHWDVKRLKHLAEIDSCGSYGEDSYGASVTLPVATTAQIDSDGHFNVESMPVRGFSVEEIKRFGCKSGDVLVVKSSGSATNIISGKVGLVDETTPAFVFSNFLMRIRPLRDQVSPKFVYALLRSHLTRQRVLQMCSTTTFPNLKIGEYCSALLPFPPLSEQVAIAAFLDRETAKVDALVAKKRQLIDALQAKRTALISQTVTRGLPSQVAREAGFPENPPLTPSGIQWLGDVPEHWKVKKVKSLATFSGGGTPSRDTPEYWNGDIPWVSPKDMKAERIDGAEESITQEGLQSSASNLLPPGRVLMVVRSGILKHTIPIAINEIAVALNQDMKAISFDESKCVSRFFLRWVQGHNDQLLFAWAKQGATVESIEHSYFAQTVIPLPPPSEQVAIVAFLDRESAKIDALVTKVEAAIEKLQEYRTALISSAVTGKIDVRSAA